MEKINTDCKRRTFKKIRLNFKIRKPWRSSFKKQIFAEALEQSRIVVTVGSRDVRTNTWRHVACITGGGEGLRAQLQVVKCECKLNTVLSKELADEIPDSYASYTS